MPLDVCVDWRARAGIARRECEEEAVSDIASGSAVSTTERQIGSVLGLYNLPGLLFAAGCACTVDGKWEEIFRRREKSSRSASTYNGDASETMMLGLRIGGACSLRGKAGSTVECLGVDEEGCEGRSGLSRGTAVLRNIKKGE